MSYLYLYLLIIIIAYFVLSITSALMILIKCKNINLALQDELLTVDREMDCLSSRQLQMVWLLRKTRRALLFTGCVVLFIDFVALLIGG